MRCATYGILSVIFSVRCTLESAPRTSEKAHPRSLLSSIRSQEHRLWRRDFGVVRLALRTCSALLDRFSGWLSWAPMRFPNLFPRFPPSVNSLLVGVSSLSLRVLGKSDSRRSCSPCPAPPRWSSSTQLATFAPFH